MTVLFIIIIIILKLTLYYRKITHLITVKYLCHLIWGIFLRWRFQFLKSGFKAITEFDLSLLTQDLIPTTFQLTSILYIKSFNINLLYLRCD